MPKEVGFDTLILRKTITRNFHFILSLTVSVPHDFRLVFFHSGINDDSAAEAQCLPFRAKSHFKFVNNGGFKGNTMLRAKTIYRHRKGSQH